MRGNEQPPARVDMEISAVDAARVDVLDRFRLDARGVEREYGNRVLAADKNLPATAFGGGVGAVRDIGEAAIRMHLDRADRLSAADIARLRQRTGAEHRCRRQLAAFE